MRFLSFAIVFLCHCLFTNKLLAASLPEANGPLIPEVEYVIDPDRHLNVEQAVLDRRWQPMLSTYVGFEDVDLWVRFPLVNPSQQTQRILIEDQWPMTDAITFYVLKSLHGPVQSQQHSGHKFFNEKSSTATEYHRFPNALLDIPPGTSWIYVHYQNNDNISCRLALWNPSSFREHQIRDQWVLGLLLGFVLVMSFYNFCLYLMLKIRAYLYYSCYVIFFFLFQLCMQGLAPQLLTRQGWWLDQGIVIFAMLTLIFVIKFTKEFTSLKQLSVILDSLGTVIGILSGMTIAFTFHYFQLTSFLTVVINLILVGWLCACTFVLIRKKIYQGYIYALAWSLFIVGDTVTILYYIGILKPSALTQWGMMLGSTVEVVLLSFGLAYYVQQLRRDMLNARISEAAIKSHLETAQSIQTALVTREAPKAYMEMATIFLSAETVAGDWYSVETSPDGSRVYALVGDVTGHGISSALVTGAVSGSIQSSIQFVAKMDLNCADSLMAIAEEANRVVTTTGQASGRLMTLLLICFDLKQAKLHYLNAGHMNFYQIDQEHIHTRIKQGSILGSRLQPEWSIVTHDINVGDKIIFFTDGLLENPDKHGRMFSQRELLHILKQHTTSSAHELTHAIRQKIDGLWEGLHLQDDVTFVSLKIERLWHEDQDLAADLSKQSRSG